MTTITKDYQKKDARIINGQTNKTAIFVCERKYKRSHSSQHKLTIIGSNGVLREDSEITRQDQRNAPAMKLACILRHAVVLEISERSKSDPKRTDMEAQTHVVSEQQNRPKSNLHYLILFHLARGRERENYNTKCQTEQTIVMSV